MECIFSLHQPVMHELTKTRIELRNKTNASKNLGDISINRFVKKKIGSRSSSLLTPDQTLPATNYNLILIPAITFVPAMGK